MGKHTKPKPTKSDILKRKLIEALEMSLGVVTTACKKANVNRSTFYEWYNNDEEFKAAVDGMQDIALDFVESSLFKQVKDGNASSTQFYLRTKGRRRGYQERQEVIQETTLKTDIKDMSDEDLKKKLQQLGG